MARSNTNGLASFFSFSLEKTKLNVERAPNYLETAVTFSGDKLPWHMMA